MSSVDPRWRLGVCASPDDADVLKRAGFDFLEIHTQAVLQGRLADDAWAEVAVNPDHVALPMEAANCLIPSDMPIVGPRRDPQALRTYMQRIAERGKRLGVRVLVFGSGGARRRPDGVNQAEAWDHLTDFVRMAGDVCAEHDIDLVIEHLNQGECNTVISLAEGTALARQVGQPRVGVLVDSFHWGVEGEPLSAIDDAASLLRHVHVAEPDGRTYPGSGSFEFGAFFKRLRTIGYAGRVSIEGRFPSGLEVDAGDACRKLRAISLA